MSQEFTTPPVASLSWDEVWFKALLRPSVESYTSIVNDPRASPNRAYKWVAVCALIGYVVATALQVMLGIVLASNPGIGSLFQPAYGPGALAIAEGSIGIALCGAPFAAALAVLGLTISAGLLNLIATMLGGTGSYSKLVYAFATFGSPLIVISSVLGALPCVNVLVFPLSLYWLALSTIAVKAVHQFSWGKAVGPVAIVLVLAVVSVVCVFILFMLYASAQSRIFSNIIQNI